MSTVVSLHRTWFSTDQDLPLRAYPRALQRAHATITVRTRHATCVFRSAMVGLLLCFDLRTYSTVVQYKLVFQFWVLSSNHFWFSHEKRYSLLNKVVHMWFNGTVWCVDTLKLVVFGLEKSQQEEGGGACSIPWGQRPHKYKYFEKILSTLRMVRVPRLPGVIPRLSEGKIEGIVEWGCNYTLKYAHSLQGCESTGFLKKRKRKEQAF